MEYNTESLNYYKELLTKKDELEGTQKNLAETSYSYKVVTKEIDNIETEINEYSDKLKKKYDSNIRQIESVIQAISDVFDSPEDFEYVSNLLEKDVQIKLKNRVDEDISNIKML